MLKGSCLAILLLRSLASLLVPSQHWIKRSPTCARSFRIGSLPGPAAQGAACPDVHISRPVPPVEAPFISASRSKTSVNKRLSSRPEAPSEGPEGSGELRVPDVHLVSPLVCPLSSSLCIGGRLRHFLHAWDRITSDPWVLATVRGFRIELIDTPTCLPPCRPREFSPESRRLIDTELWSLVEKGAIERAPDPRGGVVTDIFLVEKKGGQFRPVINLKSLNVYVRYRHFKMEGIHLLRDLLLPDEWMVKLDLKDAYLTVPIAQQSRDLLRFRWGDQIWRFTCLPFGLSSAPWCFTKLMKPVVSWLRGQGVRLIIYLDDMLLIARDPSTLLTHLHLSVSLLTGLGFVINHEKSCLQPSRSMEFLGFRVDSSTRTLCLPMSKVRAIRRELRHSLRLPHVSLRHLARVLGLLSSSIQAVFPAPLHYRALQRLKIAHLRAGATYGELVVLDQDTRDELTWWIHNLDAWNGKAIVGPQPDVVIESDASLQGWGARCEGVSTRGPWSTSESSLHINALELLAGSFAIRSFVDGKVSACIRLRMDNVSAVRYVNSMGGTRSAMLTHLAKEFWSYCLDRGITVVAEYIPGLLNVHADWSSRYISDFSDWRLDSAVFSSIDSIWGPFSVDLFTSRWNAQLPRYYSWRPDPHSEAVDALLQDWSGALLYAFPPFALIPRVLSQVRRQQAELVLVVPFWRPQTWFPQLMELLIADPILLPAHLDLLLGPRGQRHPLLLDNALRLLACRISGVAGTSREYRKQLDSFWKMRGSPVRFGRTEQPGEFGLVGAWDGTWIPFRLP
ncbi:uncharacterized protein LOC122944893 [Bufo gargarizans]|uniref:uncharacterized protein LOC122944893 n=1 Tax=Bufo gargarizans TaxID=30331 RepID=UPI001CF2D5B0|nr:uncharacterized protein LOC122944893 [Bufo gargarizans]